MDANYLVVDEISVTYPDGFVAVESLTLRLRRGEIVGLVGPSGSGKSTLLRAIAGLEPVSAGRILLAGVDCSRVPTHRRSVGMVFQDGQLFPHYSVGRNIAYGLPRHRRDPHGEVVNELLDLVGLTGFNDRAVTTLSGGQAQRVALVRTLAPAPQIVLFDEPLSSLDTALKRDLAADIRRVLRARETTAIYVTHDETEAQQVADRVVDLRQLQASRP
ncbi:MAG: ABC transporter ATP-binding protein [Corynebacterium sp.]|nr:ABC transporter ATP-binding protein [Corynebacterium sp.]